jgi:hypothetical protein
VWEKVETNHHRGVKPQQTELDFSEKVIELYTSITSHRCIIRKGAKEMIKIEVREELRKELVAREIFESLGIKMREKFKLVDEKLESLEDRMDEKFKSPNFKLNLFWAIALIALAFANPAFVELFKKIF